MEEISLSEENYLKAIFHLQKVYHSPVSTNALAGVMETKASSATEMLKKLAEKNLVIYKKYQGVKLSKIGNETATKIVRKHRLWEVFLLEKLNFTWDEVHEVAEQLEHVKSEKLIRELDNFLNYPKYDPHGDPIPDAQGNIQSAPKTLLAELEKNDRGICTGVKDSSAEFLRYLDKNEIALGKEFLVLEKEDFDQSMLVEISGNQLNLSNIISTNLFIKKI